MLWRFVESENDEVIADRTLAGEWQVEKKIVQLNGLEVLEKGSRTSKDPRGCTSISRETKGNRFLIPGLKSTNENETN